VTSLFAEFLHELQTKQLKFDAAISYKMNEFEQSILLPLACFDLEIWFLSAKFSFYRGILQRFFLFIFQEIVTIEFQLFCLKLVQKFGKSDVRNFVKNNFCFAS
jgi:hypothetical protein